MADLTISIKIGPSSARDKKTFDSSASPAAIKATLEKKLLKGMQDAAAGLAYKEFTAKLDDVQKYIRDDLETFARQALQFFFNLKSSETGQELRIRFNDFSLKQTRGLGFKSAFSALAIANPDVTVIWPALSARTLRNKRGNTTYFVHSGDLFNLLSTQLFPFLKDTLVPTVRAIKEEVPLPTGKTTQRVARVEFTVAASKRGVNLSNVPALKSGSFKAVDNEGKDFDLIKRYLGEEVAFKLTNLGHEHNVNRPLVSPLLGYYVINRFPKVLEASIKRHFKVGPPRDTGLGTQFEGT